MHAPVAAAAEEEAFAFAHEVLMAVCSVLSLLETMVSLPMTKPTCPEEEPGLRRFLMR